MRKLTDSELNLVTGGRFKDLALVIQRKEPSATAATKPDWGLDIPPVDIPVDAGDMQFNR